MNEPEAYRSWLQDFQREVREMLESPAMAAGPKGPSAAARAQQSFEAWWGAEHAPSATDAPEAPTGLEESQAPPRTPGAIPRAGPVIDDEGPAAVAAERDRLALQVRDMRREARLQELRSEAAKLGSDLEVLRAMTEALRAEAAAASGILSRLRGSGGERTG